jgi:hypothetical protein
MERQVHFKCVVQMVLILCLAQLLPQAVVAAVITILAQTAVLGAVVVLRQAALAIPRLRHHHKVIMVVVVEAITGIQAVAVGAVMVLGAMVLVERKALEKRHLLLVLAALERPHLLQVLL